MATIEITLDNFEDMIAKNDIVLMDSWAEWCGPCRMFGPIFDSASEKHADIVFGKCNTDEQGELAAHLQIMSIPTLMIFRDNILVFRQAGALPEPALEEVIAKVRELDMEEVRASIEQAEAETGEKSDKG
jgi:thioredoxin 1